MNSVLYPACAAAALLAFIYKVRVLRTDRSMTQIFLLANFLLLTLIFTVSTPVVWVATSRAVGIVNFSGLFTQSCVILMAASQQMILLSLSHAPKTAVRKARPRLIALGLALVAMIILFSAATSRHENPTDFAVAKAQFYPSYLLVYLVTYGISQIDVQLLCIRYAKIAPTPWLRRGLYLVGLTMPIALVYTVTRLADIVAGQFGISGHAWEPLAQWSVTIATVVNIVGWTLPDWGRYLSTLWQAWDKRRAYRDLMDLHRSLTTQIPEPVLPLGADAKLDTRLYRRMVEIRDAQWALRPWMYPGVRAFVDEECDRAGLTGNERAAVTEAALLRAAVWAKVHDESPLEHDLNPRAADPEDLASELAFQRQLAHAFTAAPIAHAAETCRAGAASALSNEESPLT
ncbi:MAB_1171c family putative transporter [Streptomyces sp. NPDC001930]|uniref:MAB_1171c family putative transporter n=1 Tax=Streptomyces sp. NPDC001930 TaxID=3364625 RepID=UPI0036AB04B9